MTTLTVRTAKLAATVAVAVLLAACSSAPDPAPEPPSDVAAEQPDPEPDPQPEPDPDPEPEPEADEFGPATIARTGTELHVYDAPEADEPARTLPATTSFGSPRALLVTTTGDDGWLEVLLPERPNGGTGWIRADDVELETVDLLVEIDLDARELTVHDGDDLVLTTPTAVGDDGHPTPTGTFYVTDKLDTGDPNGPYGPYAIGLSAWSDVLTEFAGGDGQVGIHGTNAPDSIGQAASHGCLRVDNGVIEQLAHLLPLGTPVVIS